MCLIAATIVHLDPGHGEEMIECANWAPYTVQPPQCHLHRHLSAADARSSLDKISLSLSLCIDTLP